MMTRRFTHRVLVPATLLASVLFVRVSTASAEGTIYVDLSGIDTMADLTDEQKQELKDCILADIWANFALVLDEDFTVTDDASEEAGADRVCRIKDELGTHERSDGSTGHHYGSWTHGSKETNVFIDNFTDRHGDDYKSGDPPTWDIEKLCTGIARTAAHELAHSYSVGHNDDEDDPNKMTEGGLVSSESRANDVWIFDDHTGDVLNDNWGDPPCESTTDYDEDVLLTDMYDYPEFPYDPDEVWNFDALFSSFGLLAWMFDLGWYGADTDGGAFDGNPDFDFIKKTTMLGTELDAQHLTFFTEQHNALQFVLRGRDDSPFAGEWFPMSMAEIIPEDFVTTPDGKEIFRSLTILWDVDGKPGEDVGINLNANMAMPPYGAEFNGWTLAFPQCAGLVPWFEPFITYPPDINLHGQCGWKGWDGDAGAGAFLSELQSLSAPFSVDIQGPSDLVHEHTGAFSGQWSYSAWQYIPTEFTSGGGDPLAGSYFILLNTYNDGGPYNWSVQMQFDSNDGMMKVFHGEGLDTINVPYITDQWVKIEAIVDLENDWTQVYYDDNLITEYQWTGGVLGDGGGAFDIAAVDLFAQGSTSIFYDDLQLQPLAPPPCPEDTNDDGTVDILDLLRVLAEWGTSNPEADVNDDGTVDILDLLAVLAAWGPCP